ncbi:MAG: hypothetical protein GC129_03750 [Proteobacteria bacterium]|nr:hypothetical protein [Pseudomonadota bacterium]
MPKSVAPSPKANLLRGIYGKLAPKAKRLLGEMARVRGNATTAEREFDKAETAIAALLNELLERTGLPVVREGDAAPAGEHWLVSGLVSRRNVLYARDPVSVSVAYVAKDGTCPVGAVFLPLQDVCILAEEGLGVSGEGLGRLRVGQRGELKDTLALLPWKTADALEPMRKLDDHTVHTRKTGSTLADVVEVAMARADMAVATRLTRLEALLANLIMAESGGFASDIAGKPLGPQSTTLVAANPKLHAKVVDLLSR